MRISVAVAVACLSAMGISTAQDAQAAIRKDTTIPAQGLGSALQQLANDRDVQLVYRSELVGDKQTRGAAGELTFDEALTKLLAGTGLTYQYIDEKAITIVPFGNAAPSMTANSLATAERQGFWHRFRLAQAATPAAADQSETSTRAGGGFDRPEPVALEEVIVTAQKRDQMLIDVPISITALSGENLTENHINNMQGLSFSVPSMSTAEIGPGRQVITVRGLGGYRGNTSLTGVYLDDMPVSGLQDGFLAQYIDLGATDLERVEVLKGPQGTLYGEGSVGGTVRFITKDPDLTAFGGRMSVSLYDTSDGAESTEAVGVLNIPLAENRLGMRVEAAYENEGGWIDRVATVGGSIIDQDMNDNETLSVRTKVLWAPTENLAVKGLAVIRRGKGGGSNIVNVEPREESKFIVAFSPTAPTGFTDDYDLYNLTVTYDSPSVRVLSSTSYADTQSNASFMQRKPLIPAPNPGFQELLVSEYAQNSNSLSQEVRITSSDSATWDWTLGAFYRDAELIRMYPSGFDFWRFGQPSIAPNQVLPGRFDVGFTDVHEAQSWAVFGDLARSLGERFEVGVGVRYFEEEAGVSGFARTTPVVVAAPTLNGRFSETTYRTYLSYALAERTRFYGSVATGFRSGGFNGPNVITAGGPPTFEPETVTSYELGTKTVLAGGTVSVQAAVFYSEYVDIQMSSIFQRSDGTPVGFTGNPGEAEIKGFEAELTWAIGDRLTFTANGDVIEAELTQVDSRVLVGGVGQFQVGDPIDLVPEYSFAVALDYRMQWSAGLPGYLRLQYSEQGQNTTVLRTLGALEPVTHTPVLNFLAASIGATWQGWDLELFGRNLLDEAGALRTGGGVDPQARPRTFGVRLQKSF